MKDGIPNSIRVGAHDVAIRLVPTADMGDDFGMFTNHKLEIVLSDDYAAGSLMVDTVIHEILHAICFVAMKHYEADEEERICGTMASQLTQVFRDNPALVTWISRTLSA